MTPDEPPPARSGNAPHPELGWQLLPNSRGRNRVTAAEQTCGPDGFRVVKGQPSAFSSRLNFYGCSWTFGYAVGDDETFCTVLQGRFPDVLVKGRAAPGWSTVQSLIMLEKDLADQKPDVAVFCYMHGHKKRNVAHPDFCIRMRNVSDDGYFIPRGALDAYGNLKLGRVRLPRPDLTGVDLTPFCPDFFYMNEVTYRIWERAHQLCTEGGVKFRLAILQRLPHDAPIIARARDAGMTVWDIDLERGKEMINLRSNHPTPKGHAVMAQRIGDRLAADLEAAPSQAPMCESDA